MARFESNIANIRKNVPTPAGRDGIFLARRDGFFSAFPHFFTRSKTAVRCFPGTRAARSNGMKKQHEKDQHNDPNADNSADPSSRFFPGWFVRARFGRVWSLRRPLFLLSSLNSFFCRNRFSEQCYRIVARKNTAVKILNKSPVLMFADLVGIRIVSDLISDPSDVFQHFIVLRPGRNTGSSLIRQAFHLRNIFADAVFASV